MKTCHTMKIILQNTGGDAYELNGKIKIPNKTLDDIRRDLLLKSSHMKELLCLEEIWCFAYHYAICLVLRTENRLRGDVTYLVWN